MASRNQSQQRVQGGLPKLTYNEILKLRAARTKEFTLQGLFKYGYRNKEDVSNLPANTLVVGSQNVLTNAAEQVAIRNGYILDGAAGNQNNYGVDSSYDFNTHTNGIQNLRKWGTNLECRYQNPNTGVVSWINILSTLIAGNVVNFTNLWEGAKNVCLFVNGNLNVYRWTGAVAAFLSATSSTITVQGTKSLGVLGFDNSGVLLIDGQQFSYTAAGAAISQPYSESPTNAMVAIDLNHYIAQKITTGAGATQLTTATVKINFSNVDNTFPGLPEVTAFLYTDNAGVPGAFIENVFATASSSATGDYTLTFNLNVGVSPLTNYWIILNTGSPANSSSWVLSAYIGASSGVGTLVATTTSFLFPTSWSNSNGYLNMVVNENDISTTIFTGVTPDPTTAGIVAGDAVIQQPNVATTNVLQCSLTEFDLISNLKNQIYYGSLTDNTIFITKVDSYSDATVSTPRVVGEGARFTLDAPPVGFVPEENEMYVTAGRSYWYVSKFTLSSDLTKESVQFNQLKTSSGQAAQSQALISKLKNSIVFVSNEPIFNAFGPVKNVLADPQVVNMSDPIKYDMDAYNFSGGSAYYFNYFVYFTVPKMGVVRLYNVNKKYWEAPQVMPISRFYEVNAQLYGHSSLTNESYQLFVPNTYNDNGNPISAVIAFPYVSQEGGAANEEKSFNKQYTEGYISSNTNLMVTINYDFGGFSGTYTTLIQGANRKIVFNKITDGSLGQNPLGSEPIGTILNLPNQPPIPKFRVINTFPRVNCFEYQVVYSTDDIDQNFALLRFGPAISPASDLPVQITI